ncbi:unnamed protein product [Ranitomeya imitator]|uniref:Uncharacterized protein n=1 Tax=Ranitomeya imitator TaxID=111125 RepID=A0ABN9LQ15_9NEOB|nr:unnamed protein product [Ranitomeya imitator]
MEKNVKSSLTLIFSSYGVSIFLNNHWCSVPWCDNWIQLDFNKNPITLELFPIFLSLWGEPFRNRRITFHSSLNGFVFSINCLSSKCDKVSGLSRHLGFICLCHNIWLKAKFSGRPGHFVIDSLSLCQMENFRIIAPLVDEQSLECPVYLWNLIGKIEAATEATNLGLKDLVMKNMGRRSSNRLHDIGKPMMSFKIKTFYLQFCIFYCQSSYYLMQKWHKKFDSEGNNLWAEKALPFFSLVPLGEIRVSALKNL